MIIIDEVPVGPDARVYAEGWQSWSPTTWYHRGTPAHRPAEEWQHTMRFRPGADPPDEGLQGEGLLVVDPGGGAPARVYGTLDASSEVPSIRAEWQGDRVVVDADAPIETWTADAVRQHLGRRAARARGVRRPLRRRVRRPSAASVPRVWCSWYRYFEEVTAADVLENLRAIDEHGLGRRRADRRRLEPRPRRVDGAEPAFGSLADAVDAIRTSGRRAGIWLAPFSSARDPTWRASTPSGSSATRVTTGATTWSGST